MCGWWFFGCFTLNIYFLPFSKSRQPRKNPRAATTFWFVAALKNAHFCYWTKYILDFCRSVKLGVCRTFWGQIKYIILEKACQEGRTYFCQFFDLVNAPIVWWSSRLLRWWSESHQLEHSFDGSENCCFHEFPTGVLFWKTSIFHCHQGISRKSIHPNIAGCPGMCEWHRL